MTTTDQSALNADVDPVRASGAPEGKLVPAGEHFLYVAEMGAGAPTVFLHGGGPGCTTWTDFRLTLPYFAAERRCILVDMINVGYSSAVAVDGPLNSFQAEHVAQALISLGVEGADFVCNSIGGSAALLVAARYPQLVRKLVITGSAPIHRDTTELSAEHMAVITRFAAGEGPTREKITEIMLALEYWDPAAVNETTLDLRWHYLQQPGPQLAWVKGLVTSGEREDLEGEMAGITAPVLFFCGRYDPFVSLQHAIAMSGAVPYGDLYIMDAAGHHMEEERPAEYAALVLAWLRQPPYRREM